MYDYLEVLVHSYGEFLLPQKYNHLYQKVYQQVKNVDTTWSGSPWGTEWWACCKKNGRDIYKGNDEYLGNIVKYGAISIEKGADIYRNPLWGLFWKNICEGKMIYFDTIKN